jgi:ribosomal protein S2
MYYNKLILRKRLVQFWIFLGNNYRNIFKINYQLFNIIYNKYCVINYKNLILNFKQILPMFINISQLDGNILFVSSKFLYCQTIYNKFYYSLIKKFIYTKIGIFTNFCNNNYQWSKLLDCYFNPSCIIVFNLQNNNLLILEAKKKNIPIIGVVQLNSNICLVDYPISINCLYFYAIYFISKLFFKLILLNK